MTSSPVDSALQAHVDRALARWSKRIGPGLAAAFGDVAARLGLLGGSERGYFLHPLALPVLQLPGWIAATCAARGRPVPAAAVERLVEAAAVGYLHVRVHDDLLDEGVGEPVAMTLLADALATRHHALVAATVGADDAFWVRVESVWSAYAEAMLAEQTVAVDRAYDAAAFDQLLDRSRPLVLPPLAVATVAGLGAELGPTLDRLTEGLVRGHQLFVDLIDVDKDLEHANPSWIIARFGGLESRAELRRRLYLGGGFDEIVAEVNAALDGAHGAATELGSGELIAWIQGRRERVAQVQQDVFVALFTAALGE